MIRILITKSRSPRLPNPWLLSCSLALLLCAPAYSQSPAKPKSDTTTPEPPSAILPSRYINEENLPSYCATLTAAFSMRNRETDPFGQLQDPNAKPVIKSPIAQNTRRIAPAQATPFSDIIRMIKVTTIMPREKQFLVGTRSIKQGDRIPLVFRGKTIQIEVVSVQSHQIDMRNIENGETASLKIRMLPPGMTPGNHNITAPGMVPDRPNAPIDLDGSSKTDNSPNR